jgi:hypothetical protein
MILWQSSSAPAGRNSRLPAYRARYLWSVQVLGLNGESPFASESSACPRLPCRRARRGPCSEGEGVASTPLQERVFRSICWSQCSHRTIPAFVLNMVVVRRSGRRTQEMPQTTGVAGP